MDAQLVGLLGNVSQLVPTTDGLSFLLKFHSRNLLGRLGAGEPCRSPLGGMFGSFFFWPPFFSNAPLRGHTLARPFGGTQEGFGQLCFSARVTDGGLYMSKAFAARSPSDCGSWWTVMAIASAIELGSLRLFVFRGQGDDHIFLVCVSSGVCVWKNHRAAHLVCSPYMHDSP